MYVYKKSDKKKENPIHLSDGVRYKTLWNKAQRIQTDLRNSFMVDNLMFEFEDEETQREIYKAIDCLQNFKHNLKLKDNIVEEQ